MSFATYASQFLKQGSASTATSNAQPLFFSFTTDEGSVQLNDGDDPHFGAPGDEEDPYLRLDDDDDDETVGLVGQQQQEERRTRMHSICPIPDEGDHNQTHPPPPPFCLATPDCVSAQCFLSSWPTPPDERPPPALLHTIPLVTFLTILSAILAYTHLALLRAFLRPVLLVSALAPPFALFLSAIIAFAGSFSAGAGWGLRLFALVPLALAVISVRRLPEELRRASRSPALLSLSTRILFFRAPLLLVLSPLVLLAALILSLPIMTLLVRLPLSHSWYMQLASAFVAFFALHVFFLARSIQRSVVAGGVGAWYFRYSVPVPADGGIWNTGYPELDAQLRIIHAALLRPLGPIVLAALYSLILSLLSVTQVALYWLPLALPYRFIALFADLALAKIHGLGERIGGGRYTGVYCGLTGSSFGDGVRGVRELRAAGAERAVPSLPLPRPYTLALPFALVAYLRTAGDRDTEGVSYMEQQRAAIVAAVLAGLVCAAVSAFCAGVVRDGADTLYVCHLVDRAAERRPAAGDEEREAIWGSFDPTPADGGIPQDAEAMLGLGGLNIGGFNLGGLFAGAGGTNAAAEQGGRGEEPVYARLRRAELEETLNAAPPPSSARRPSSGAAPSRGFRPPSRDFSAASPAVRNYSPPPHVPQAHLVSPIHPSASAASLAATGPLPLTGSRHTDHGRDSDADSLDSEDGRGGESSSAFPGSGFF
ncbi:hypothetical protein HMN09_00240400 [Mycena chlorophos]|uniref:Protein PNS1 n=1 Tax=Mycena chlorophos TaxID=658473 RepID=A0A8H6TLT9_MYCCL|nr:hypothetical protein HMN09_00240400 [Mycena chlorophos]